MTGTGDASAVPDQLSFGVGVTETRADLGAAMDAATASMNRVLAALGKYDVARSDVQTTGLSMTPVYDYHPTTPDDHRLPRDPARERRGRDLRSGGKAVAAAVAAGGNAVRVSGLRLLVGDPDAATARARDAAVAEAKAKGRSSTPTRRARRSATS